MDTALIEKIKLVDTWLEKNSIKVSFTWLKSVIQIAIHLSDKQLIGFVFNCWLNTDLFETACEKLPVPDDIESLPSFKIEVSYSLQINKVQDISQSPYDQWLKLTGQENEDIPEEGKGSRVLKMEVTDGFKKFIAIEALPIPKLSINTKPGTKIRITGVINCYAGQIMLKNDNLYVLGGNVKSLHHKNCHYNILARLLDYPELPDPDDEPLTNDCVTNTTNREEPNLDNGNLLMDFEDEAHSIDMTDALDKIMEDEESSTDALLVKESTITPKICCEPYTYLALALAPGLTSPKIVFVKAFVATVKGKLEKNYISNKYGLDVLINDGTMVVEASLSSSIIEDIVGFEAKDYRKNVEKCKAAVSNLQRKLLMLNTILKIELNPSPLPHKILSLEEDVDKLNQLLLKSYDVDFS